MINLGVHIVLMIVDNFYFAIFLSQKILIKSIWGARRGSSIFSEVPFQRNELGRLCLL